MDKMGLIIICNFLSLVAFASGNRVGKHDLLVRRISSTGVSQFTFLKQPPTCGIYHAAYKPIGDSVDFIKLRRKAKLAKWLGIGSLIGLVIPVVNVLCLPAAIVSIILAGQVKKEATDKGLLRNADIGKKTSIATLIIIVVALIISLIVILAFLSLFRR